MAVQRAIRAQTSAQAKALRARAELAASKLDTGPALQDALKLVHELQVHQIELTMQNEELQQTRLELEQSIERYTDLYEFAPVGYLTVDPKGVISAANLQMATMLGIERRRVLGAPLSRFAASDAMKLLKLWREITVGPQSTPQCTEIDLLRRDGTTLSVQLSGTLCRGDTGEAVGFRVSVTDITARKQAQLDLQKLNESLELRVTDRTAQLRTLILELSRAEHRERDRLAQVLHGNVQQILVGAKYIVASMARSQQALPEVQTECQNLQALLEEANQALRSLSVDLSPPVLFELGLAPALHWLARRIEAQHGLTVIVDAEQPTDDLAQGARAMFFDAASEFLLNVVKHSGVKHARIRFQFVSNSHASLAVEDDGAGFTPERLSEAVRADHFGLSSIRARFRGLGGSVEIVSAPSAGTRVTVALPVLGFTASTN